MQKGFGLLEVLFATAIMGGLSLLLMRLNEEGIKGVAKVEKTFDILSLDSEINSYLGNKSACTHSLNLITSPIAVANISGAQTFKVLAIKNKDNILVFDTSAPVQQKSIRLKEIRVSDYDNVLKVAKISKFYSLKVSANREIEKVKISKISLVVNASDEAIGCILKESENDGPWSLADYGIFYDGGTVGIRTGEPVDSLRSLSVEGEVTTGSNNQITVGTVQNNSIFGGLNHLISDGSSGTIIGGSGNIVSGAGRSTSILGGEDNVLSGGVASVQIGGSLSSITNSTNSFIGGGRINTLASNSESVILGGLQNSNSANQSAVIAGSNNTLSAGSRSAIIGGIQNTLTGARSSVIGGSTNTLGAQDSAIVSGSSNTVAATGYNSTVLSSSNTTIQSAYSTVISGSNNRVLNGVSRSIIFGGNNNEINNSAGSSQGYGIIIGGDSNNVSRDWTFSIGNMQSRIAGSRSGIIGSWDALADGHSSIIIGGIGSKARGQGSMVINSSGSRTGPDEPAAPASNENGKRMDSVMVIGSNNSVVDPVSNGSTGVAIGQSGIIFSSDSKILKTRDWGFGNVILGCKECEINIPNPENGPALAIGMKARVWHSGSTVMVGDDTTGTYFSSAINNSFNARYKGGFRFCTNPNNNGSNLDGCFVITAGGATWIAVSDKNQKKNIKYIDGLMEELIANGFKQTPIYQWKYKFEEDGPHHLGPMAQDFYKYISQSLGLESGEKSISQSDMIGVQAIVIKHLLKEENNLKNKMNSLEKRLEALEEKYEN